MIGRRIRENAAWLLLGLTALVAGCETGFVQDAARDSLAAFLSDIFTTVVNDTIAGD